jgi:hypothetical protein
VCGAVWCGVSDCLTLDISISTLNLSVQGLSKQVVRLCKAKWKSSLKSGPGCSKQAKVTNLASNLSCHYPVQLI